MVVSSFRNSELNLLHPLEPFIKANNALTEVSVSALYMYNNTTIVRVRNDDMHKYTDFLILGRTIPSTIDNGRSTVSREILLVKSNLRPLTVAEKILYLNE